jgi:hypothetical protein
MSGKSKAKPAKDDKLSNRNNDDDKHDGRGHGDGDHNDDGRSDNGRDEKRAKKDREDESKSREKAEKDRGDDDDDKHGGRGHGDGDHNDDGRSDNGCGGSRGKKDHDKDAGEDEVGGGGNDAPVDDAGVNLLVDGSFETAQIAAGKWTSFGSVGGWQSDSGVEIWGKNFIRSASDGEKVMELDFDNRDSRVWQDVKTEAGAAYTFAFDFAQRPDTKAATNTIEVWWNGPASVPPMLPFLRNALS